MVIHNFEHAATAEALQCFGSRMLVALLRSIERLTHDFAERLGGSHERTQSIPQASKVP